MIAESFCFTYVLSSDSPICVGSIHLPGAFMDNFSPRAVFRCTDPAAQFLRLCFSGAVLDLKLLCGDSVLSV